VRLFCDDFAFMFVFGWSIALFMDKQSTKSGRRVFATVFLSIKNYFVTVFLIINFQFSVISGIQITLKRCRPHYILGERLGLKSVIFFIS